MLNRAVDARIRPDNPVRGVRPFKEEKRKGWLKPQELERLFALFDAHPNQQQAGAILLLAYTGARKGELSR